MIKIELYKYSTFLDNEQIPFSWQRNYQLTLLENFPLDISDYFLEDTLMIDERLEFKQVFEFMVSKASFSVVNDLPGYSINLLDYINKEEIPNSMFGVKIYEDDKAKYFGYVDISATKYDEQTNVWNISLLGWWKYYSEKLKECYMVYKSYGNLLSALTDMFPLDKTIVTGFNIQCGNIDTSFTWLHVSQLGAYNYDTYIADPAHTPDDIFNYLLQAGIITAEIEPFIRRDENIFSDLTTYQIISLINPIDGNIESSSRLFQPSLCYTLYSFLFECQKEFGAYIFIDAEGVLNFVNRQTAVNADPEIVIDNLIIDNEISLTPYEYDNDFNSILFDYKYTDGGITAYGYYLIFMEGGTPHYSTVWDASRIPKKYKYYDMRHKFSYTSEFVTNIINDEIVFENITEYKYGQPKKVFNNSRNVDSVYNDYKSIIEPVESYSFKVIGTDYKLCQKIMKDNKHYQIRALNPDLLKDETKIEIVSL